MVNALTARLGRMVKMPPVSTVPSSGYSIKDLFVGSDRHLVEELLLNRIDEIRVDNTSTRCWPLVLDEQWRIERFDPTQDVDVQTVRHDEAQAHLSLRHEERVQTLPKVSH
jgi:hypothetical protein